MPLTGATCVTHVVPASCRAGAALWWARRSSYSPKDGELRQQFVHMNVALKLEEGIDDDGPDTDERVV